MKAAIIRGAKTPGAMELEFPGWIVPDTGDMLGVDLREPADLVYMEPSDWRITHLPTGYGIRAGSYTDADTRERAVEIAQAFYREMNALGVDLTSPDPATVIGPVAALSNEGKRAFWERVAGWSEQRKMVEAKVDELQAVGLVVNSDTTLHPAPSSDQPGEKHD
jgi:hypothetical protein